MTQTQAEFSLQVSELVGAWRSVSGGVASEQTLSGLRYCSEIRALVK